MIESEMILEFHKIKEMLCERAVSEKAKKKLLHLKPFLTEQECQNKMQETTEAKYILDQSGTPPLATMKEIEKIIGLCSKGSMLLPEQLESVSIFIGACNRMKQYLKKSEAYQVDVAFYGQSIYDLSDLQKQIEQSVQNSSVLSSASTELKTIRRKLENCTAQIKKKLEDFLRGRKTIFSDHYVVQRNGRYVVPVKKEYKNQVNGTVIDISGTGGTYFMEPETVSKLQDEKTMLEIEEDNEIRKILYLLTALVEDAIAELEINIDAMEILDILFAKAKLSADMNAKPVSIDASRWIQITQGKHPLLKQSECVPLDFSIGGETRGIIITGPNTGGKTVALKTVGLLSMMAQSGLHVPVESGKFSVNHTILCDIGDGQSISENLSTFSAHIKNMIEILRLSDENSLILLDELGSGTDPGEGMGIAISILEELCKKHCLFLVTTHYPEVKEYAAKMKGTQNARMTFDRESLKPLYQLEIGEAGESCALYIARRLGFPEKMLKRAYEEAYKIKESETRIEEKEEDCKEEKQEEQKSIPSIQKKSVNKKKRAKAETVFQIGDSVILNSSQEIGIVFQSNDEKGMVGVQVKGKKCMINYKRLKLKVAAKELYPENYDFSIIFDSVETRKGRHQIERKYVPDLIIEVEERE